MNALLGTVVLLSGVALMSCSANKEMEQVTGGSDVLVIGTGVAGFRDSPSPQFNKPIRLAPFDGESVLVADIYNHAIRVVHKNGEVRTLAGSPERKGHQDGPSEVAGFDGPHGVAMAADGAIVVAEASNHTVRLLRPAADTSKLNYQVTTLAGVAGKSGFADGSSRVALFSSPHAIVAGEPGQWFLCDIGNARVRALNKTVVATLSGGEATGEQTYQYPMDLAVDKSGTLFIIDAGKMCIFKQEKGNEPQAIPLSRPLLTPHGICVAPDGTLVVAELRGHRIVAVNPESGVIRSVFGTGKAGSGAQELNEPAAVLIHAGKLWIADLGNHQVKILDWPPQ